MESELADALLFGQRGIAEKKARPLLGRERLSLQNHSFHVGQTAAHGGGTTLTTWHSSC
jgi:hypothetical protein